jgi:hypothetical protein
MKDGTYYLGRVLKLGQLNQELLLEALRNPALVKHRANAWTITDILESEPPGRYIFGRLSKYAPEGEVGVVDEASRSERRRVEPNLLIASSPFVYIPEHSGIAFLYVSGSIEPQIFRRRFSQVVEQAYGKFFLDCDIDLIADLRTFAAKVSSLDGIYKIEARVSPPNPLFGPLWRSLKEYLAQRNADRMTLIEDAPVAEVLKTQLPELVSQTAEQSLGKAYEPEFQVSIGDAAILMSIDGYGVGKIRGRRGSDVVVIKTSETAMTFAFPKEPEPLALYVHVLGVFEDIQRSRHMEHGS